MITNNEPIDYEEPTIECNWCHELFTEDELLDETDLGHICYQCVQAILSRGEKLIFEESF
jgi:formylmethanofuran dehydrogenase subunit E